MTATFHVGDAIEVMSKLPERSVDLILTSPPFLALRSYLPADHRDKALEGGSQATPGEYVDWLIDVVEAGNRVLAPHGSLCIELGDTYSGKSGWDSAGPDMGAVGHRAAAQSANWRSRPIKPDTDGWPLAKSLSLIPELFRLTLVYGVNPLTGRQTERWRLRNVVRWVRPNPPVGALGDKFRPATSELMVFCKSAKRYFDLDAVREPLKRPDEIWPSRISDPRDDRVWKEPSPQNPAGAPPLDWWEISTGGFNGSHYAVWPPELLIKPIKTMCPLGGTVLDPFAGSGTTALVATGHGRDCILIDLDERNYEMALQRVGPFILSRAESV